MLGLVRGVVRGAVAWLVGLGVTAGLSIAGIVDGSGVGTAGRTYVSAHAVPPESASVVVAVPVLAIGIAGVRAGRSLKSGVTGRIRSFVRSVRGGTSEQVNYPALLAPFRLAAVGHSSRTGLSRTDIVPRGPLRGRGPAFSCRSTVEAAGRSSAATRACRTCAVDCPAGLIPGGLALYP